MTFLKWFQEKLTGKIVADYGELSSNIAGVKLSVTLRLRSDGRYFLVLKWEDHTQFHWEEIEVTPEVLARFEAILKDVKVQLKPAQRD